MKKIIAIILGIFCCIALNASAASAIKKNLQFNISGISGNILKNVQARLAAQGDRLPDLSHETVQNFYQQAPTEIKAALSPYGYFKPVIVSQQLSHTTNNIWTMSFQVVPGPVLAITQLDVQVTGPGKDEPAMQQLLKKFPLAVGQTFSAQKYDKAKDSLFATAAAQGYLAATMTQSEIRIDLKRYTADIILHFDTGECFYFGTITFAENPLSTAFLKRYLTFKEGDPYSTQKLNDFQQALNNSNYFQQVYVHPKMNQVQNAQVPIHVGLQARKSQQYSFGLGFGTDTGVRTSLGVELRRLTKTGHYFNTQLQLSQIMKSLQANYVIPGHDPAKEKYVLSAFVGQENNNNGYGNIQKLIASDVEVIHDWQQTIALSLQREHFTLNNVPPQTATMLIPSGDWMKLVSDNELRPNNGYRIDINLLGSVPGVLSNTSFLQTQVSAKTIRKISKRGRLLLRGTLGYTDISDLNKLPLSFQFYTGGSQTVRGYGFNTIGPGRDLMIGSVEYRYKVLGNWYAATFLDAGNVSNQLVGKLNKGIGVGAVWQSPVGTLELTVAQAQDAQGRPLSIQFNMGTDL